MCVFNGEADASDTTLYGGFVGEGDDLVQVTGYQNTVRNLSAGPNMMIIPVPAVPGTMGPHSFLDTEQAPHVLDDMVAALTAGSKGMSFNRTAVESFGPMQVFSHGIYDIALGHHVTHEALVDAFGRIARHKRPEPNWSILLQYPQLYDMWTLIFACFDNRDAARATPLMWRYRPMELYRERAFLPALDSHSGRPPVPGELVHVDHTLLMADPDGAEVEYRDDVDRTGLRRFLPDAVVGLRVRGVTLPNGDFVGTREIPGRPMIERTHSTLALPAGRHLN